MKKILAILLAGMMTATAFAGCGGSGSSATESKADDGNTESQATDTAAADVDPSFPDVSLFGDEDNITLKVWAPDKAVALVTEQVKAFQEHYTDKTFTSIEVVAQGESDAATQIINDPEKAADVFGFPSDQMNKLMDAQALSPVAPALSDAVVAMNAEKTVAAAQFDGELYAFPETNDNGYYLVYDKTAVSDEQAQTLEGVLEACKAAGKQFIMDSGNGFYACVFPFTGGAVIDGFEEDGETQKFVDYDEDEVVKTIMAFAKLMKDYKGTYTSQDPANISTGFKNGKVAAGVDGTWNAAADKDSLGDNMGAAKLPTIKVDGTDKQMISMFGYKYIGVNSHTKFQRSAQILGYYLAGQDCQQQRAEQLGWGPSNKVAQEATSSDPILAAVAAQAENAVAQVNIAGTFWTGFGTLGSEIYKDNWNADDQAATKELFEKAIANVRDE